MWTTFVKKCVEFFIIIHLCQPVFCQFLAHKVKNVSLRGRLRRPWQSQGIPLDAVHGRTIVYVKMYNEQHAPTVEKCFAGDSHGPKGPRNDMLIFTGSKEPGEIHRVTIAARIRAYRPALLPPSE